MAKKGKLIGREAFEKYYSELYGGRWEALKASFAKESDYVEFKMDGASESYFLDSASVIAASALPLENATDILDLCAAPGGKTLVLASRMNDGAILSSNERSPERKHRLSTVVQNCLPPEISERVKVSCSDGSTWCKRQTECFDAILLDAPCSSERHVFNDPKYLDVWTPSRIKTVTTLEWSLLSCAFRLLRHGGFLLYSTCALACDENDGMIEKLIGKFGGEFEIVNLRESISHGIETDCGNLLAGEKNMIVTDYPFEKTNALPKNGRVDGETEIHLKNPLDLEATEYGLQILPDISNGAGPIYFCLIQKS